MRQSGVGFATQLSCPQRRGSSTSTPLTRPTTWTGSTLVSWTAWARKGRNVSLVLLQVVTVRRRFLSIRPTRTPAPRPAVADVPLSPLLGCKLCDWSIGHLISTPSNTHPPSRERCADGNLGTCLCPTNSTCSRQCATQVPRLPVPASEQGCDFWRCFDGRRRAECR